MDSRQWIGKTPLANDRKRRSTLAVKLNWQHLHRRSNHGLDQAHRKGDLALCQRTLASLALNWAAASTLPLSLLGMAGEHGWVHECIWSTWSFPFQG
jgi:hypothetical protein